MRKRSLFGVAVLLALGMSGTSATAGPAGSAAPVASARKDVKEAREELREARKDGGGEAGVAAAVENLKKAQDKLHETRVDRRKAHVEELQGKWKDVIGRQDGKEAIKVHVRREARLHRMKAVAMELGKTALVTRIDALIAKEQTRFEKKMSELKEAKK